MHAQSQQLIKSPNKQTNVHVVIPTEDSQWRAQALECMQKRLEEEHGLKMSLLLAEQEKEQQCPHLVGSCNHKVCQINILCSTDKLYFSARKREIKIFLCVGD